MINPTLIHMINRPNYRAASHLPHLSPSKINYFPICVFLLQQQESGMSLFIGNVSKKVTHQQFEDAFKGFGNCKIDLRKRYAFVQFESERCAEEARLALQNTNFSGLRLNIEWSKNSGRFNENTKSKNDRGGPRRRRSNSRERSWRKEDRIFRRSPSFEKRHAPTYSDNEDDLETFVSKSPRDAELIKRLKSKREEGEMTAREARPLQARSGEQKQANDVGMELQAGEAVE